MTVSLSVSWNDAKKKRVALLVAVFLLTLPIASVPGRGHSSQPAITVIVQAVAGRADDARQAVGDAGGTVTRQLGIIGGFAAEVPARAVDRLRAGRGVAAVTLDSAVHLNGVSDPYDPATDGGSMFVTSRIVGARE